MSTAADEISTLSTRLRDPQLTATTEEQWLSILSQAQPIWNAATMRVLSTATITLEPYAPVYTVNALIPDCIRILSIYDQNEQELHPVIFSTLRAASMTWLRDVAGTPREWGMLGRDLLVVYPAVTTAQTLTVTYIKYIAPMAASTDSISIPDHDLPGLRDFAEAIACLKLREFKLLEAAATRLKKRLGA